MTLLIIPSASAVEMPENYLPLTVCIAEIEPDLFDTKGDGYVKEAKTGIEEWEVHLKQTESKKNKWIWDIDVKIIPWHQNYYGADCTVGLEFFYKPENVEQVSDVLGEFWIDEDGFSYINVYVGQIGYDVIRWSDANYRYFQYEPVYEGFITTAQVGNIVRHEFGHFLGLDHVWDPSGGTSPYADSIMTPNINFNTQAQQIRPRDIEAVRDLHPNGFAEQLDDNHIPEWIRNNAEWWSQGLISDNDFVKGIQYLVEQGVIVV